MNIGDVVMSDYECDEQDKLVEYDEVESDGFINSWYISKCKNCNRIYLFTHSGIGLYEGLPIEKVIGGLMRKELL